VTRLRAWLKDFVVTQRLPQAQRDAVLLTFDDGPHPEATPGVLEVLRKYSARAVFFIVGSRVRRAPHMLRRILDEGHILGNHSFAHPLDRQFGLAAYRRDVESCQDLVMQSVGCRPVLFRPPLGHTSPASLIAPRLAGLTPMLWSVDSEDWRLRRAEDVPAAARRLGQQLSGRPLREIVLLHDERQFTVQLLELVLPDLVSRRVDLRPSLRGIDDRL
jgi:peptidoglycan/xylan/chitin deacetylase (PgdA/CDA1 family)